MIGNRRFNRKRVLLLNALWVLLSLFIVYSFLKYGVFEAEHFRKKAQEQWIRVSGTRNDRGEIFDSKGNVVAKNVPGYEVWINSKAFHEQLDDDSRKELIEYLVKNFEFSELDTLSELNKKARVKIGFQLTDDQKDGLLELEGKKCLEIHENYIRSYPEGAVFTKVLGLTDKFLIGTSGIELTYNNKLQGSNKMVVKKVDSKNQELPFEDGKVFGENSISDVYLTVDKDLQKLAHDTCIRAKEEHNANSVSILVMNPKTGDILAHTDSNVFDPETRSIPDEDKEKLGWDELSDEEKLRLINLHLNSLNINSLYEPGSTFKTITLSSAIEEGAVDDSTELYCNGAITDLKDYTIKCIKYPQAHGKLDIKNAYAESCNVAFVQIGRLLNKQRFLKYIKAFGFGERTGIELNGEERGMAPKTMADMSDIALATYTYGHGISVTPIQLATAVSAVVNGGNLMIPRIVKELKYKNGEVERIPVKLRRKVISKETSDKMRELMEYAVENGNRQAKVEGYRIGGKSGTSIKLENHKYNPNKIVASFIGVAPIDDPKILVLVIVDEPKHDNAYGGAVAGPYSSEIMKQALESLNIKPLKEGVEERDELVIVPDIVGMELTKATEKLLELDLRWEIELTDNADYEITSVEPKAGTYIKKGSVLNLEIKKIVKEKDKDEDKDDKKEN